METSLVESLAAGSPIAISAWRISVAGAIAQYERRFNLLMLNKDKYDSSWCNAWKALGDLSNVASKEAVRSAVNETLQKDIPSSEEFASRVAADGPLSQGNGIAVLSACARRFSQTVERWYLPRIEERLMWIPSTEERAKVLGVHWMLCVPETKSRSYGFVLAIAKTWSPETFVRFAKELDETKGMRKALLTLYGLEDDRIMKLWKEGQLKAD